MLERLPRFNERKLRVGAAVFIGTLSAILAGEYDAHASTDHTAKILNDYQTSAVLLLDSVEQEYEFQHYLPSVQSFKSENVPAKTAEALDESLVEVSPVKPKLKSKFERMPSMPKSGFGPAMAPDVVATQPKGAADTELREALTIDEMNARTAPTEKLEAEPPTASTTQQQTAPEKVLVVKDHPSPPVKPYTLPEGQLYATEEDYDKQKQSLMALVSPEELALREKYGDARFSSLEDMPEDFKAYYLGKIDDVAEKFDVPPSVILTYLYAEQMGNGFGWESRTSHAYAVGEGQITRGHWNGWDAWKKNSQALFQTDVSAVTGPASANDANGDGIANVYDFEENISATAWDIARNGLTNQILEQVPSSQREVIFKDALAVYNSGKVFALSPAETRPYVEIGKHFLAGFDPGFFDKVYAPKPQLYEPVNEKFSQQETISSPEQMLLKEYKKAFENKFGVPFTDTEKNYVLTSLELQDYLKTGDIHTAVESLINNQVSAAMAHPDQYPFYCNLECKSIQELALEKVGSQLGSLNEIKTLLDWSANNNGGVINMEDVSRYIEHSPQAEIHNWFQKVAPQVMNRELTKAEMANFLFQAYQAAGAAFLDMPGEAQINDDQQRVVINELRRLLSATEDFKINAPDILKVRELAPLGPLFVDQLGNAVPMRVREYVGSHTGIASPFGSHGNFDFINNPETGSPDWFGEDFVPLVETVAGTDVASPITGEVVKVTINSHGKSGDGEGDSVLVKGTGEYEGMRFRALHMKNIGVREGDKIRKGQKMGEVNTDHTHFGMSLEKNGQVIPLPTHLLFGKEAKLERPYQYGVDAASVGVKTYEQHFPMDAVLSWIAPWDFAPAMSEQYKDTVKTYFTHIYNDWPQLMKR